MTRHRQGLERAAGDSNGRALARSLDAWGDHRSSAALRRRFPTATRTCISALAAVLILRTAAATLFGGDALEVRGTAELIAYSSQGAETMRSELLFRMLLAPPAWNLRVKRVGEDDVAYHEAGANDTSQTFYLMRYSDDVVHRAAQELAVLRANPTNVGVPDFNEVGMGRMVQTSYPWAVNDSAVRFIWFALASGAHLDLCPTNRCEPYYLHDALPDYLAPAFIRRLPGPLRLPANAVFMSDGIIDSTRYRPKPIRYPPPCDHGFTGAVYSVTSTTNYHGLRLPLSSELAAYFDRPGGRSARDLIRAYTCSIFVTNIATVPAPADFAPALPGIVLISDERFRGGTNLPVAQVLYTNSVWPSAAAVTASSEFKSVKAAAAQMSVAGRNPGSGSALLLIAAVLIVPPAALLLVRFVTRKYKPITKE